MIWMEQKSQADNLLWRSECVQDAAKILGLNEVSEEVPTSAHIVFVAQIKLRRLRRELSAILSGSMGTNQMKTGPQVKAGLRVKAGLLGKTSVKEKERQTIDSVWLRIRNVQAARDKLLLLCRGGTAEKNLFFSEKK